MVSMVAAHDGQAGDGEVELGRSESGREAFEAFRASGGFDEVLAKIDAGELQLTGQDGFLHEMVKAVLERGLQSELTSHLGYDKGDPVGRLLPNSRNGFSAKTVSSEVGDVTLAIPRDRDGSFIPTLVPKGSRRIGGLDSMIISLYAGGMTIRDIEHHLATTIGTEISHETISKITDAVLEEVLEWQRRPLDAIYPIVYLDALVIKIRDGHQVRNKSAHIAVGVDIDGIRHVLGIWVQPTEGAKFWAGVCAELANRGVKDVLIACVDGLTGFGDAIAATWPHTIVQTCTVHLLTELTPELLQLRAGVVMVPRHGRAGGGPTGSGGSGGRSRRFVGGHRRRVAAVAAAGSVRRAGCGGGCVLAGSQRGWPVLGDATVVWAGVVAVVPVLVVGPGAVESGDPGGSS